MWKPNLEPLLAMDWSEDGEDVTIADVGNGYSLKLDQLRKENHWTAIGPEGRLGDVATLFEAVTLIEKDYETKKDH